MLKERKKKKEKKNTKQASVTHLVFGEDGDGRVPAGGPEQDAGGAGPSHGAHAAAVQEGEVREGGGGQQENFRRPRPLRQACRGKHSQSL